MERRGRRASSARSVLARASRARGDDAPRKSDRTPQRFAGKYRRRNDRRRATPRATTTRRGGERPTRGARGVVTLASRAGAFVAGDRWTDGREPCDRGGTAGRRRGPETSSGGWDPRGRRARWWRAAGARARRRCRRSRARGWAPSGMPCAGCSSCRWSSAMDECAKREGKSAGLNNVNAAFHSRSAGKLFSDWIPIRVLFPPNRRVLRQRAPTVPSA